MERNLGMKLFNGTNEHILMITDNSLDYQKSILYRKVFENGEDGMHDSRQLIITNGRDMHPFLKEVVV